MVWFRDHVRHSEARRYGHTSKLKLPHGHRKIEKVLYEYKHGKLYSGRGKKNLVTSRRQAVAIALSEQRKTEMKDHETWREMDRASWENEPSRKELLNRVKEEKATAKKYAEEGYTNQAKQEAEHARFFHKEAME